MSIVDRRSVRQRCVCGVLVLVAAVAALESTRAVRAGEADTTGTIARAGTRVLVVFDAGDAASREVAEAYVAARGVEPSHIVGLDLEDAAGQVRVPREAFEREILAPLVRWWRECPLTQRPPFMALSRHLPLAVAGSAARDGDEASLDSELVLLPRVARGEQVPLDGPLPNPIFGVSGPGPPPLAAHGLCLVTRLDGFTTADALALIARSVAADTARVDGARVVVDLRGEAASTTGERWLLDAAVALEALGVEVVLDTTQAFLTGTRGVLGYASWGSNDVEYVRPPGFDWVPGALAATFVSSSARTLAAPPPGWRPGRATQQERYYAGTPQSLVADLTRDGATGASGYVTEPWLDGCVRPDRLMVGYLTGMTLATSYYVAMPYVSWRSVVLGDPIACAPAGTRARR